MGNIVAEQADRVIVNLSTRLGHFLPNNCRSRIIIVQLGPTEFVEGFRAHLQMVFVAPSPQFDRTYCDSVGDNSNTLILLLRALNLGYESPVTDGVISLSRWEH